MISYSEQREACKTIYPSKNRNEKKVVVQMKGLSANEAQLYSTFQNLSSQAGEAGGDCFKSQIQNLQINFQNGNVKKVHTSKFRNQASQTYLSFKKIKRLGECTARSPEGKPAQKRSEDLTINGCEQRRLQACDNEKGQTAASPQKIF